MEGCARRDIVGRCCQRLSHSAAHETSLVFAFASSLLCTICLLQKLTKDENIGQHRTESRIGRFVVDTFVVGVSLTNNFGCSGRWQGQDHRNAGRNCFQTTRRIRAYVRCRALANRDVGEIQAIANRDLFARQGRCAASASSKRRDSCRMQLRWQPHPRLNCSKSRRETRNKQSRFCCLGIFFLRGSGTSAVVISRFGLRKASSINCMGRGTARGAVVPSWLHSKQRLDSQGWGCSIHSITKYGVHQPSVTTIVPSRDPSRPCWFVFSRLPTSIVP